MSGNFGAFMFACAAQDLARPLGTRIDAAFVTLGLSAERARVESAAPGYFALAEEALARSVAAAPRVAGGSEESARSRFERHRRERLEARGQRSLDLDLHGASTAQLKDALSFTFWIVGGAEMSVEAILADHLARAQVLSDLAGDEARLRAEHEAALRDLHVWQELRARADAAEAVVAQ